MTSDADSRFDDLYRLLEQKDRELDAYKHSIERILEGFPSQYSTKSEVEVAREHADQAKSMAVSRDEYRAAHDSLKERVDESQGRRTTLVAVGSVLVAILIAWLGFITQTIPTHTEIRSQIQSEAPWVSDRPQIEKRLGVLENRQTGVLTRLGQIDQRIAFFCRTRVQAGLPAC